MTRTDSHPDGDVLPPAEGGRLVGLLEVLAFALFSPVFLGSLVLVSVIAVWKLPLVWCERLRSVRSLPYFGLGYYGLIIPLVLMAVGLKSWEVVVGTVLMGLSGDWLLPDPITFLFHRRNRQAVRRAIEFVEAGEALKPHYRSARVIGTDEGRTIVSVEVGSFRPPSRRFLTVADATLAVEELDFEAVATRYGVKGRR